MCNEMLDSLIDELARAGITRWAVEHGGKHPKLRFSFDGRDLCIVYPGSSSDHRAQANAVSFLRRILGVRRAPPPNPTKLPPNPGHRARRQTISPPPAQISARPDPFAALARLLPAAAARGGADPSGSEGEAA